MILKVEIDEELGTGSRTHIEVNFINGNVIYERDGKKYDCAKKFNRRKLEYIVIHSIRDWKPKYIDSSVICGKTAKILIITDKETLPYLFKNSFPENYDAFICDLKKELEI